MKVIDLLNKIANGEITKLHKFKWNGEVWEEYSKFEEMNNDKSYQEHKQNGVSFMRFEYICDARNFNKEIEIIEEDKEIEEMPFNNGMKEFIDVYNELEHYNYKINEIRIAVNELKKGK